MSKASRITATWKGSPEFLRSRLNGMMGNPGCCYIDLGTVLIVATGLDAAENTAAALERGMVERAKEALDV